MARKRDQGRQGAPADDGGGALDPAQIGHVSAIVAHAVADEDGDLAALNRNLYAEIVALARFIQAVKQEIATLHPDQADGRHLPMAADELASVVGATEAATHEICAAAEAVESLAPRMSGDLAAKVTEEVTRIYESCGFQDLTGQRIGKVVGALQHIEAKMHDLLRAFGDTSVGPARATPKGQRPDAHLMQGPQAPGEAKSQDEIDALLASLE